MRHPTWIVFALLAACSSNTTNNPAPVDASATDVPILGQDTVAPDTATATDAPRSDVPRTDGGTSTDLGVSSAGNACTTDDQCGTLGCEDFVAGGFCTADCENNATAAREQEQCGGRGSTCLAIGDGTDATTFCTHQCNPTARTEATGACRAGLVCTGWWYTHEDGPDTPGCDQFCTNDSQCATGTHCNTRFGNCQVNAIDTTRRADGEPCDPSVMVMVPGKEDPENIQCRGGCFQSTNNRREGVCASLINLGVTTTCPDNAANIHPLADSDEDGYTDNLGLCWFRECATNADCTSPLVCVPGTGGDPAVCDYPDGTTPTDAGVPDAGATDAGATDASSGGG